MRCRPCLRRRLTSSRDYAPALHAKSEAARTGASHSNCWQFPGKLPRRWRRLRLTHPITYEGSAMNDWIAAAIAAGAGLILGVLFGRFTQGVLSKQGRPDVLRASAGPMGSVVFSAFLVAGLTTALGFVNTEARDQIPQDMVDYIPSLLSAAIVIIGANVLAQLVQAALERTVARMPGNAARNVPNMVRVTILTFGAILAAAQLGVDTTIINIAVAAGLFSLGLGAALMVGLGSRAVTGEVAAGRAVRRLLAPGDHIQAGDVSGVVTEIQSVAVEVIDDDRSILIPHSHILGHNIVVKRASPPTANAD